MGSKKKKWYQTGEFEDGYQFGDIFRTIKNAIDKDEEKPKKSNQTLLKEKEKTTKNVNSEIFSSIYAPDNMGRLPDADTIARRMGYKNAVELKEYKKTNPELFDAMGGIKYDANESSILDKNNIRLENLQKIAKDRIVDRFQSTDVNNVQEIINILNTGKWQDADTMKKYSDIVNSYVNDYVALDKLGYFNSVPEIERTKYVQALKSVKEFVESQKEYFAVQKKQESGYFQKGALQDGFSWGNLGQAIKGTVNDVKEGISAGFIGMGEVLWDGLTMMAAANHDMQTRMTANDAVVHSAIMGGTDNSDATVEEYTDMSEEIKDVAAKMVAYDLYDEQEIARAIIAGQNAITQLVKKPKELGNLNKVYTDEKAYLDNEMEGDSVFASKSDALAQTTGHYAAQVALKAVGVPWYITAGVSAMGGEAESALRESATFDEAGLSGTISAGGEIIGELIFGGPISGMGFDDIVLKKFANICANKVVLGLAKFGIKTGGEGFEELVSDGFTKFGQWLTYQDEKTFKEMFLSEEAMEQYVDSFIGGMFLGGLGQGYEVANSKSKGIGYATGLTENETKVVDRVYKETISEALKDKKEITYREKSQIYDDMLQQVKSGQVDTRTIEVALGGEDYGTYKNVLNNYEILQQKLNELQSIDNKAKTPEQTVKEQEIKQRLEQTKIQADKLKNILQNKVAEKIDVDNIHLKDRESYLWDSYVGKLPNFANDNLNSAKMSQEIDEDAFVEGLWDDGKDTVNNDSAEYVENSGLKLFDNVDESSIIKETVDNDTGVPGEYTTTIGWSIFKKLLARPAGAGYYTKKIKQRNPRVEAYEIKINPNKEGYHVRHPDGRYVQFENMVNNVLLDGKCVLNKKRSFYHVYDKGDLAKNRVLQQANRQIEVANAVGYKVEWLVSDEKAVAQLSRLFKENNVNISVKYYPE